MEVRSSTELGLKTVLSPEALKAKRTENPANIPGTDYTNRYMDQADRGGSAIKASQTKDHYKVLGSTVDKMA